MNESEQLFTCHEFVARLDRGVHRGQNWGRRIRIFFQQGEKRGRRALQEAVDVAHAQIPGRVEDGMFRGNERPDRARGRGVRIDFLSGGVVVIPGVFFPLEEAVNVEKAEFEVVEILTGDELGEGGEVDAVRDGGFGGDGGGKDPHFGGGWTDEGR